MFIFKISSKNKGTLNLRRNKYANKKYIKTLLIASFIITLSNTKSINADSNTQSEKQVAITETTNKKDESYKCGHHHRGEKVFEESINELRESGVLSENDINKINEYMKKEHEQRKVEMKKKRDEKIDNMVNENVISKDKGNKLKEAIDKSIEKAAN